MVAMQHLSNNPTCLTFIDFAVTGVVIAQLERFRYSSGTRRRKW
ncbi:hypothetical protein C7S15_7941 [Burkholderia cepacia]|nr:hypothetical protein [Burkholderia cepacia]